MTAPASAADLVARVEAALAAGGLQPIRTTVAGHMGVVGSTSAFKWRWMATKLNSFVYIAAFNPGSAASGALDQYLAAACQDAIDKKGLMRGAQSGVAAVTVAAIDHATPEDEAWAAKPHGRRFAAITFPTLADPATGKVIRPQRMILGGIYKSYLQDLVKQYVEGPLHS
ncbi:MAG TPA: hypothetical protein VIO34_03530 [Candidatus Dormibacteraeota bacterium]